MDMLKLQTNNPMHYTGVGNTMAGNGAVGAGRALPLQKSANGTFADLLKSKDAISTQQQSVAALQEQAITDPDSVEAHQITIAQAQAQMSLNIARTVINRLVQGWQETINMR